MPDRILAIGDIHGCVRALDCLLDHLRPKAGDLIITLGDYIDRGPNSPEVIERLIEIQALGLLLPLLGNHEIMFLVSLEHESERHFWLDSGGQQTLDSYGGEMELVPQAHVEFIRSCQRYWEGDQHFCIHANYDPTRDLAAQNDYVAFWEHLTTNVPGPHKNGKTAIVGHTPQRKGNPLVKEHLVDIDTFCYGSGYLTALDLHAEHVWQANKMGALRQSEPVPLVDFIRREPRRRRFF